MNDDTANALREPTEPPKVTDELGTMRRLAKELDALDTGGRRRVLRWLVDRYQPEGSTE